MQKPSYNTTKRYIWSSFILSWTIIMLLAAAAASGSEQAVAFASIAVPSLVGLIVLILGIHRGFGSIDMMTASRGSKPDPPEAAP